MTTTPNFCASLVVTFKKMAQSLISKMSMDEGGGDYVDRRDLKWELQKWLDLFHDNEFKRPLFSAQLVDAGLVKVLDDLKPKEPAGQSGAKHLRDVAHRLLKLKNKLLGVDSDLDLDLDSDLDSDYY